MARHNLNLLLKDIHLLSAPPSHDSPCAPTIKRKTTNVQPSHRIFTASYRITYAYFTAPPEFRERIHTEICNVNFRTRPQYKKKLPTASCNISMLVHLRVSHTTTDAGDDNKER
ncbi:unnamed protein product [Ceratitis capitata]|uniref:(Mediterranean fruit fly) hypothetical protein n=1 Tax=Ceratitis capitata TaxID=7213 RepID=A0A811VES1_CERCA|nr:unnamed protein product [Ceratitis capitata]